MEKWYIFDCFGTLVKPVHNEWAKLLLKQFSDKEERKKLLNMLMITDKSIEEILDSYDNIPLKTKNNIIQFFKNDTTELLEDAQRILYECYTFNTPFVLFSNLSFDFKKPIDTLIKKPYGDKYWDLFEIFYSCEMWERKPQLEWYELPIQRLQDKWIDRKNITMIWDNLKNDYITPLSLGIQAILLDRNGTNTDPTIKKIKSFDELDLYANSTLWTL